MAGVAGFASLVACSSSTTHVITVQEDGGPVTQVDGSITNNPDGGEPNYDLPSTTLLAGQYNLVSIIGDQAIIRDLPTSGNITLSSIPIAGGTPTKIFEVAQGDGLAGTAGALAHWVNVANGVGQLDVWTPATGLKTAVAQKSVANNLFASSDDGSRIAFSQDTVLTGTTPTSTSLAVRDTASATNLVTLNAATQTLNLNAAQKDCVTELEFGLGVKDFFAMYCTGTDATVTAARIYSVPAAGTAATRLDDTTGEAAADSVDSTHGFSIDLKGDKIAWVDTAKKLKAIAVATPAQVDILDTGASNVTMLGDGSAVIYGIIALLGDGGLDSVTLKKATIAATPAVSTVATVPGYAIIDGSNDGMKIVFAEVEDPNNGTSDLHFIDFTQATPKVVDLVTGSPVISEVGFTGDNNTVVWNDLSTGQMASFTAGASAPANLVPGNGGLISDTGTDLVVFSNPTTNATDSQTTDFDIGLSDAVSGGAIKTIATSNPSPQAFIKGKTLVYTKDLASNPGIFTINLP